MSDTCLVRMWLDYFHDNPAREAIHPEAEDWIWCVFCADAFTELYYKKQSVTLLTCDHREFTINACHS